MAYNGYKGSTVIGTGLIQRNNGNYPLVHANDVQVGTDSNSRLQNILDNLDGGGDVPSGGTTGQVLAKKSSSNYDLEWIDNEAALPPVSASDNGKILKVVNGAWAAVTLPSAEGESF